MAKMFPSEMNSSRSPGEREVFDVLKLNGPKSWHIFHSEVLTIPGKVVREIDFIVLVPSQQRPRRHRGAIICLEVKGGCITKDESGNWYSGGERLGVPPLRQAWDEMFLLKDYLEIEFDGQSGFEKLPLQYAAVLPDCPSPEVNDLILDRSVIANEQIISRLEDLVVQTGRTAYDNGTLQFSEFDDTKMKAVIDKLPSRKRNEAGLIWIDGPNVRQSGRELARLTEEQLAVLELVEDDDGRILNQRVLFEGGAGTGKTVMAMELAKRRTKAGDRVAFVCATRGEAAWSIDALGNTVAAAGNAPDVIFQGTPEAKRLGNKFDEELKRIGGPDLTLGMVAFEECGTKAVKSLRDKGKSWDYLIVDEVQHMVWPSQLKVLSGALRGGLQEGNWAMFGDFETQNLGVSLSMFSPPGGTHNADFWDNYIDARVTLQELSELRPGIRNWVQGRKLSINCRNTVPISEAAAKIVGSNPPQVLSHHQVTGPKPIVRFWTNRQQLQQMLTEGLWNLHDSGIGPGQIAVFYDSNLDFLPDSVRVGAGPGGSTAWRFWSIDEKGSLPPTNNRNRLVHSCNLIDAAGMESEVVILIVDGRSGGTTEDAEVIEQHFTTIFNVGITRAKTSLIILSHRDHQGLLERIQPNE